MHKLTHKEDAPNLAIRIINKRYNYEEDES